jgi:hypothetical protein
MKYELECWKCDNWHETESLFAVRFAKMRIRTKLGTIALPDLQPIFSSRSNGKMNWGALVDSYLGKCTSCNRLKLNKNLWYAEPGGVWCRRCM